MKLLAKSVSTVLKAVTFVKNWHKKNQIFFLQLANQAAFPAFEREAKVHLPSDEKNFSGAHHHWEEIRTS